VSALRLALPLAIAALPAAPVSLAAQEETPEREEPAAVVDSVVVDSATQGQNGAAATDSVPRRPVSPMGAFVRSLVIPGWGQAALGKTTRGAFYFTMEATSLWMLIKTQAKLDAAERAGNEDLINARTEQREDWVALAVFWALFAGVDAWVSAHLWGFEGEVVAPPDGSAGVAIQYSVPLF
jgi:hypothetical protein